MPPLGVSLFQRFRCDPKRQPAPYGPLRHPPLPGVSRFRRIGSHLRRVQAYGPALWQRPPAPDAPPILVRGRKQVAADLAKIFEDRCLFEEGVCRWHITGEIPVRTRPLSTHAGFPKSAR